MLVYKLIERNSEVGRGVAYRTPVGCHLLNAPELWNGKGYDALTQERITDKTS